MADYKGKDDCLINDAHFADSCWVNDDDVREDRGDDNFLVCQDGRILAINQ